MKPSVDLTGQKFGRWTVLHFDEEKSNATKRAYWVCKCSCEEHTIKSIRQDGLGKRSNSCGCLQKEVVANYCKDNYSMLNQYDLTNKYGVGYTSKGEKFLFDLDKYNLIKEYCWYIDAQGYVVTKRKNVFHFLHRLVTDCPSYMDVDHIHGESSRHDNRLSNLRVCTTQENCMNHKIAINNASGVTGVSWDNTKNKWVAQITANGKHRIKRFDEFDNAVAQRKKWERELFGEFSYDSSMEFVNE